jgi:hypothetical protein
MFKKREKGKPHPARCLIYFRLNGERRSWAISAMKGIDDDITLKKHLESCVSGAEYLSHKFSEYEMSTLEMAVAKKREGTLP